ncbi:hypothetical protein N8314_00780 [Akkermansiaceae bacterium]|nr:hypothetical protein [Akkermansiaceae bacterium]
MTKLLQDGDVHCYAIGSLTNKHPFLTDTQGKPLAMPMPDDYVRQVTEDRLQQITEDAGCDTYEVHISGDTNFRNKIAVTYPYKAHRNGAEAPPKPPHHATVKAFLLSLPNTVVSINREADDTLANAQTKDTVIATVDKDLLMVEGKHYNWNKKDQGVIEVTYEEGIKWFFKQLLIGDWATDRILGCGIVETKIRKSTGLSYEARKGIGDKKADQLLSVRGATLLDLLDIVEDQYRNQFRDDWKDKLNEMARLLWMGGSEDNLWEYSEFRETLIVREATQDE